MNASTHSPRIILFTEHRSRELDAACAIHHALAAQHSFTLEIVSLLDNLQTLIADRPPQIVIVPIFASSWDFRIRELMALCPHATFLNLQYEQLLFDEHKIFKGPKDTISRHHVIHLAFGDFFKNHLLNHSVTPANIHVVGSISCALYHDPYASFYDTRNTLAARHNLNPNRPWLFIPENYSAAFLSDQKVQNLIDRGFVPDKAHAYRDFANNLFTQTAPWWRDAAQQFDIEIILRPRPATAKSTFTDKLVDVVGPLPQNLHIIKEGAVREWVLASDRVASSYSTTLIEAATANKPTTMMLPLPMPDFLNADFFEALTTATTQDAFFDFITTQNHTTTLDQSSRWINEHLLRYGDPIANIADIIARLAAGHLAPPPPPIHGMKESQAPLTLPINPTSNASHSQRIQIATPTAIPIPTDRMDPWEDDRFTPADLRQQLQQWGDCLGAMSSPKVN